MVNFSYAGHLASMELGVSAIDSRPVQKIVRSTYLLAGRCPGAPEWVAGQGRAGGAGGCGGVAVKVFKVFSQDRFCSVLWGRSSRTWTRRRSSRFSSRTMWVFNSASWSRTAKRGSGGAVLRTRRSSCSSHLETWTCVLRALCIWQSLALVFMPQLRFPCCAK